MKISFGGSALRSVELLLSAVYKPIFNSMPDKKWGRADNAASGLFRKEMDSFITNVRETLRSEESGIELPKPDPKYDISAAGFTNVNVDAAVNRGECTRCLQRLRELGGVRKEDEERR